jgi:hypothetical protein
VPSFRAIVGNVATNNLPSGWLWLHHWPAPLSVSGFLVALTAVVGVLKLRAEEDDEVAQVAQLTGVGSPAAVTGSPDAVLTQSGGLSIVNSPGVVINSLPQPLPELAPNQIVVGDIPREPVAFQTRMDLADQLMPHSLLGARR